CCYGSYGFSEMIQCREGHLFCKDCVIRYCQEQIGNQKASINCIDADGCDDYFPDQEVERVLPEKELKLLQRIRQKIELNAANIQGLEECPFCPFAMVIDNPEEKVFQCQKEDCMKISCRKCKKESHLPKTCEEVDQDKKIDGLHQVEEAMSEALLRVCPNERCKNRFIKEDGCNKMWCPSCRTSSCYLCGAVVSDYSHFRNAGGMPLV
ncbi:hypothetical protein BT69DRAFT_1216116, partial [Atractiella rhizophila]